MTSATQIQPRLDDRSRQINRMPAGFCSVSSNTSSRRYSRHKHLAEANRLRVKDGSHPILPSILWWKTIATKDQPRRICHRIDDKLNLVGGYCTSWSWTYSTIISAKWHDCSAKGAKKDRAKFSIYMRNLQQEIASQARNRFGNARLALKMSAVQDARARSYYCFYVLEAYQGHQARNVPQVQSDVCQIQRSSGVASRPRRWKFLQTKSTSEKLQMLKVFRTSYSIAPSKSGLGHFWALFVFTSPTLKSLNLVALVESNSTPSTERAVVCYSFSFSIKFIGCLRFTLSKCGEAVPHRILAVNLPMSREPPIIQASYERFDL